MATGRFATFVGQDDIREIYATLLVQLLSNDMHKLRTFDPERGNRFGSWIGLHLRRADQWLAQRHAAYPD